MQNWVTGATHNLPSKFCLPCYIYTTIYLQYNNNSNVVCTICKSDAKLSGGDCTTKCGISEYYCTGNNCCQMVYTASLFIIILHHFGCYCLDMIILLNLLVLILHHNIFNHRAWWLTFSTCYRKLEAKQMMQKQKETSFSVLDNMWKHYHNMKLLCKLLLSWNLLRIYALHAIQIVLYASWNWWDFFYGWTITLMDIGNHICVA